MQYRDKQGRVLFVSDGISQGGFFGTFTRKPSGSLRRVVSKALPMRITRVEAEGDLRRYAAKNGFEAVEADGPTLLDACEE